MPVLLVLRSRLAEVDLGVDCAGKDVKAAYLQHPGRGRSAQVPDLGDSPGPHAHIRFDHAAIDDASAAGKQKIERLIHGVVSAPTLALYPFNRLQPAPPPGRPKDTISWAPGRGCGPGRFHLSG